MRCIYSASRTDGRNVAHHRKQARRFSDPHPDMPRPPYEEVWHLWKIVLPRRSITGRLLWGTVLRRRDDGQWIYKKYTEGFDPAEYRGSARSLIAESKRAREHYIERR